jgi:hypothetical protein
MAVYGGNDPKYLEKKKLEKIKKSLPPGKGWTGEYDQFGRRRNTETGEVIEALSRLSPFFPPKEETPKTKKKKNFKDFVSDVEQAKKNLGYKVVNKPPYSVHRHTTYF